MITPPLGPPPAQLLPYPPAACVDTLTVVRFVTPPTALRKIARTPRRPTASTAITNEYSTAPAPASQMRNRRMSCRTGLPLWSIGNGQWASGMSRKELGLTQGSRIYARHRGSRRGGANYVLSRGLGFARGAARCLTEPFPPRTMQSPAHSAMTAAGPSDYPSTAVATPLQVRYSSARPCESRLVACYHR
jgi:hypothetical protein